MHRHIIQSLLLIRFLLPFAHQRRHLIPVKIPRRILFGPFSASVGDVPKLWSAFGPCQVENSQAQLQKLASKAKFVWDFHVRLSALLVERIAPGPNQRWFKIQLVATWWCGNAHPLLWLASSVTVDDPVETTGEILCFSPPHQIAQRQLISPGDADTRTHVTTQATPSFHSFCPDPGLLNNLKLRIHRGANLTKATAATGISKVCCIADNTCISGRDTYGDSTHSSQKEPLHLASGGDHSAPPSINFGPTVSGPPWLSRHFISELEILVVGGSSAVEMRRVANEPAKGGDEPHESGQFGQLCGQ
ncbi:hypothetical protein BJ508DRAFT_312602 [Ascobolus immersus RN42]|uniref:Secreted protein n=1 Tax=Ascobolus immersus RN42 TaxID=1160509 RepID=A0A3N4HNA9_ASCIM|nr:hypothetical protein BJ508DRAFT_312602 [Ascobolus immersus RN42]